jgi:hypothetical protein
MNPQEAMMTLYALPSELPALDAAVVSYIHLVEATVLPSAARADVIDKLRSFQQRYQEPLRSTPVPQTNLHSKQSAQLIPLQATSFELMAFGKAILGYMRLLEVTVPPAERMEVMAHLRRFQKRYLDALPPSPLNH